MKYLIPVFLFFSFVALSCKCPENTRKVDLNPDQKIWFSQAGGYYSSTQFFNNSTPLSVGLYNFKSDETTYPVESSEARCKPEIQSETLNYDMSGNYQGYFDYDFEVRSTDPNKLHFALNSDYGYTWARGYGRTDSEQPLVISASGKPVNMSKSYFKYIGDTTVHGKSYKEVYHLEIVFENMPNQFRFLLSKPLGVVYMFGPNNTRLNK